MFLDTQALARLTLRISESCERALRTASGGKPEDALVALKETCREVLGVDFQVLEMLDAKSAAELLVTTPKVLAYAQLVETMGEVEDDAALARAHFEHAFHVAAIHRETSGPGKQRLDEAVARLLSHLS